MTCLKGWNGKILRVNLSTGKVRVQEYSSDFALKWIGGRGFAARILWEELKPGIDPLSPENKLVFAVGPLTGLLGPSTGKLVVASKSPLTGGYGDGNLGSIAAVQIRRAGYDAIVVEGKAEKPSYVYVEDEKVEVRSAEHLWGLDTFTAEKKLREEHGRGAGVLVIGPAGENLVRYAIVASQEGRAGGRPGMGAVMGSKNLKALVVRGSREVEVANPKEYRELALKSLEEIKGKPIYPFWIRQGTLMILDWCQENSCLPAYNFREGVFDLYRIIDGYSMEAMKVDRRGCPNCNMQCGNVVIDFERRDSELDYENVAMLGSNIGLGHLGKVSVLNRIADEMGIDTISLGNNIAFAMEASEKKLIEEKIEWGDFKAAKSLALDICYRRGLGELMAEGVMRASNKIGGGSEKWAMHVKGLEISAYDCHGAPGMALAFATSSIGAHHKEAWVISWEMEYGRESYDAEKAKKVVELQNIRGGMFESLVTCRFPWIEVGLELEWYPKLLSAATGYTMSLTDIFKVSERVYSQIRAFWIREFGDCWSREMDMPPLRWFEEPLTKGPNAGLKLDKNKFEKLLDEYYKLRGWDSRGVPRKSTLEKLGIPEVALELEKYTKLEE